VFFFATDSILLGLLLHLTGGTASPLIPYAVLHVTLSGAPLVRGRRSSTPGRHREPGRLDLRRVASRVESLLWCQRTGRRPASDPLSVLWMVSLIGAVLTASLLFASGLFKRLRESLLQLSHVQSTLEPAKNKLETAQRSRQHHLLHPWS